MPGQAETYRPQQETERILGEVPISAVIKIADATAVNAWVDMHLCI